MAMQSRATVLCDGQGRGYLQCKYSLHTGAKISCRMQLSFFIGFLTDKDVEYARSIHESLPKEYQSFFTVSEKESVCLHSVWLEGQDMQEIFTLIDDVSQKTPFAYHYISDKDNNNRLCQLKKDIIADIADIYLSGNRKVKKIHDYCQKVLQDDSLCQEDAK